MTFIWFAVLLLWAVAGHTMGSNLVPVSDMVIEELVIHHINMQMRSVEERLQLLENREKDETRLADGKNELAEKITEIESVFTNKQTELSTKLEDALKRLSEMEEENKRVENQLEKLRNENANLSCICNQKDIDLKLSVEENTREISQLKQELSRYQKICNPPCENGGQCVNNVCRCTLEFTGDVCQNVRQCGGDYNNGGKSIGRNDSSNVVWPWMAALYKRNTTEHVCDGSVIHPQFVLTSASCTHYYGLSSDKVTVKLGLVDLRNGTHLQEHTVRSKHVHPEFSFTRNRNYDIALLELEKPVEYNSVVSPVCLPPIEVQHNQFYEPQTSVKAVDLRTYTREISSSENTPPDVLKDLIIQPPDVCRSYLKANNRDNYFPSPDLFCGESVSSPCNLRFAAPIVRSHIAGDGTLIWTQVGIGGGWCLRQNYLFSPRLQNLMPWVNATIETALKD